MNVNRTRGSHRTHAINQQSRRAIERLGAKFEGIIPLAERHADVGDRVGD